LHNAAALLTVAIPTYNGAAHLPETLHSILSQECEPFDLLVCDDNSDDETVSLVRALAGERARIVVNDERLGLAGNWNQCMALSRTPWVNIFHQDDVMLPGHLAWVLDRLKCAEQSASRVGLIAGQVRVIDENSQSVAPSVVDPGGGIVLGAMPHSVEFLDFPPGGLCDWLCASNPLRCSAVVTNRAAHTEVGGFDPSYRYVVDWEFWYRVSGTWGASWRLCDPTVLIRWHSASETHRFKTGVDDLDEANRLVENIAELEHCTDRNAAVIRRLWRGNLARAFLNRSHEALRNGRSDLARTCLARAWELSAPRVIKTLGADPRLCLQMASLALAPRAAARWFARGR
jgi:glycosyltransferase involved in cell wall biosynthesis